MALQNPSPFSKIFVHNLSCAFRNLLDQEAVVAKLRANGVTLVSATENIGGDDETGGFREADARNCQRNEVERRPRRHHARHLPALHAKDFRQEPARH